MSDPERFDGDDGLTLGYVSELVGPDYRAKYAELAAQVRYLADELDEIQWKDINRGFVADRLRALVGPWGYEKDGHDNAS